MEYIRGSAIKFTAKVSDTDGTTAYVSVKDPDGTEVLASTLMTETTSPAASYIYTWASLITATAGKYCATIKTLNGVYPNYEELTFKLREAC